MLLTEMKPPEIDIYSNEYLDAPQALVNELRKETWIVKYNRSYMLVTFDPIGRVQS